MLATEGRVSVSSRREVCGWGQGAHWTHGGTVGSVASGACHGCGGRFLVWYPVCLLPVPSQHGYLPGTEPAGSMVTRTELSRGTGPPSTRHTYSPESTGDTWCSRSREPWVWPREGGIRGEPPQDLNLTQHLQSAALCEPQGLALSSGSVQSCARSGGRWEKPWRTGTLLPTLHQN